jgi:hypothetical protein
MLILALDVSTTCTGLAIARQDGQIIHYEACVQKGNVFEKANMLKGVLGRLHSTYDIQEVYIEEPLKAFGARLSSANTLQLLGGFNLLVQYLVNEMFGKPPVLLGASTARKLSGFNTESKLMSSNWEYQHRKNTKDKKKLLLEYAANRLNDKGNFPEISRAGNVKPSCYDVADALVLAWAASVHIVTER